MDRLSARERSLLMGRIKGRRNRSTELRFAAFLRREGLGGWRRHRDLPGRPDFSFARERLAVFIDGCFWHGCPRHFRVPATRSEFWRQKIARNRRRDRRNDRDLRLMGWSVMRVWEHQLRRAEIASVGARVRRMLARSSIARTGQPRDPA
jgi:DNA mismatch endonuclease (patch repair protein)